jgi:hypothetical protein
VAAAGAPTAPSLPSLPAATTKRVPVCSDSASSAWLAGSVPSVGSDPRLRLTTSAPAWAAHSMPSIAQDSSPSPLSLRTLPTISEAPGATPVYRPPDAAPVPAMMDATCVPCPWRSTVEASSLKFPLATTLPARSGCVGSIPVSRTATVAPVPSKPVARASGTPICGTLTSRATSTLRSSQTFATPPLSRAALRDGPAGSVRLAHSSARFCGVGSTATASMLSSTRPSPGRLAARRAGAPWYWTITGGALLSDV